MGFFKKLIGTAAITGAAVGGALYLKKRKEERENESDFVNDTANDYENYVDFSKDESGKISITINTNQFIEKENLIYQNETLSTRLEHLRERLDEAEENESKYFELYLQYSKEASFLTKNIALIDGDNPYYYHTYDCEDFQNADSFLAFNINTAENKGYVPHSCWD